LSARLWKNCERKIASNLKTPREWMEKDHDSETMSEATAKKVQY
jgi:hypothetical protein